MGKSKDMYYSLKERGLCVRCCKSKQADGHVACKSCRDKVKSYNKKDAELYKAETKLKVEIKKSELDNALKEIAEYNKDNGTSYSYGQYMGLKYLKIL